MSIRKFIAPTTRQAMKEIRDELGSDAMILSNRQTEQGVEIVAIAHGEIDHLTGGTAQKTEWPGITADEWSKSVAEAYPVQPAKPLIQPQPSTQPRQPLQFQHKASEPAKTPHLAGALLHPEKLPQPEPAAVPQRAKLAHRVESAPPSGPQPAPVAAAQENILSEIKSMSAMLQQQLAALYWNDVQLRDPQRAGLLRRMLNAGFSTLLARQLLDKMPPGQVQGELWIKQVFKRNLQVADKADDIIAKGGVYALIGPTGVGKTTTTAKLAARAVVRYGADKVALLTTDSYRIAAYEQLKIYGKILGVAVHAVKDTDDLRLTLSALRHKHLVLIDTVGMGQRDERVGDQSEMFNATGVQCLLLLNATSGGDTLEDVVRMYRSNNVVGCIPTKLDEAANFGTVLDVAVRHRLVMHYMANGQRVPEDLHPINLDYLLHRALKPVEEKTPFTLRELDFPVLMAADAAGKEASCAL
ncbi:MAG: flagellar biosynthesis protein FlhF [Gallionellales bacterium RIFCSPLOWO2_12_FULL_59_22]|nr:MAG: flagellar biosynthesis protein FlhF [Gallionellales bacterium RIFCSPLOWO2_02_FULL_59_110]OGT10600.1 MAG: flagellar biosynthesis protein FlhF [Gallionellales bacterium RIFCSPLOWO2_12_FULL_59_22]